jgi:suppressor for copper-sensitivity B
MIFAILLFIAQIQGMLSFQISFNKSSQKKKSSPVWDAFLSGLLIVLMATPCTGPYLGTTIGFALSGTPTDIFAIMGAVALGLSLPYIVLACLPILSYTVPPPGAWMKKIHIIMQIMLFLTLIWLLSILKAQSSWLTVGTILMMLILFYFALNVYNQSLIGIEKDLINKKQTLKRAKRFIHTLLLSILGSLFVLSLIVGTTGFSHHREQTVKQTKITLDFNQIREDVAKGYNVIVRIGADWCLTCSYNNFLVFDNTTSQDIYKQYNVKFINIDWTEYNPAILDFMSEYGRRGLPFYILYNQNVPEGLVLPEILSQMDFENILFGNGVKMTIPEETKEVAE